MASIEREIQVELDIASVWDAMADVGRIHERLVPGFVTGCRMEGRVRVVTFGNGMIVREPIIDVDPHRRRVAWAAVGEPFEHYSASLQAFEAPGGTRLLWISDLLPDDLRDQVDGMITQGLEVMKRTLERTRGA
jgi:hypothetical protein